MFLQASRAKFNDKSEPRTTRLITGRLPLQNKTFFGGFFFKFSVPCILVGKGKAVPLRAWSGPEGSRKLRFPVLMTTAHDGGKIVSVTHRPPLPPRNTPGTHFC